MELTGENFIGFGRSGKGSDSFKAFSPIANKELEPQFKIATDDEFEDAVRAANLAFPAYREMTAESRAAFLETIADEIMALGDMLIERCVTESALPTGRIQAERGRTCMQLKLFAELLREGWYMDARIDPPISDRQPLPRPDIRRILVPLGPVAVYGASNFPLAFSTAGGDTASALAAGCPVIVKAHSSHPGTNELVASAIISAAKKRGIPEGVFSLLYLSHEYSVNLVQHPFIKAVGFTGSRHVGMTLFNAAVARPDPIPVYAEMSAINPVVVFENALKARSKQIAKDLANSVTLGVGQFCTNPGLVIAQKGVATDAFLADFNSELAAVDPGSMLNRKICKAYQKGVEILSQQQHVSVLVRSDKEASPERSEGQPVAFTVSGSEFLQNKVLSDEVFGPATLFVLCDGPVELEKVLHSLEGQLTASVQAMDGDEKSLTPILNILVEKAGRVLYNNFPTGVEVCHSMQHGGPFPSTTDGRSTSVGTAAIYRFLRPVAYQNFPDSLLPDSLKNANPLKLLRLMNGNWTKEAG